MDVSLFYISLIHKNRCIKKLFFWFIWKKPHEIFYGFSDWSYIFNSSLWRVVHQKHKNLYFFGAARFIKVEGSFCERATTIFFKSQWWYSTYNSQNSVLISIYLNIKIFKRRFFISKDFLKEAEEKELKPKIANTSAISPNKSDFIEKKRCIIGEKDYKKMDTYSMEQTKIVRAIFNTYNLSSKKFKNLHKVIFESNILIMAYKETSKKKRNLISFTDNRILDKSSISKFKDMSRKLILSEYKTNEKKCHSSFIMPFWDKIVAYSIYKTLFFIYEGFSLIPKLINKLNFNFKPIFFNFNHGFRIRKSSRTALNNLQSWEFCNWFVKLNIKNFFDRIIQKKLLNIIRETIDDEHFLSLIQKMLGNEILIDEINLKHIEKTKIRISQDNLLSPLLANIFLHKVDEFVKLKSKETWNKKFHQSTHLFENKLKFMKITKQKNKFRKKSQNAKVDEANKIYITNKTHLAFINKMKYKVYYVRYIDDFIFGIRGPKSLAIQIKDEVSSFLKNDLHLKVKFANLFHSKSNSVSFLGFDVKSFNTKKAEIFKLKKTITFTKLHHKVKEKNKILTNKWKSFLDNSLRKKMANQADEILGGITKKINADWAINQVTQIEFLEKVIEITKSMLQDIKLIDKISPSLDIKKFTKQWRSEVFTYLKNGWIHKNFLKNVANGSELVENQKKLIESLNSLTEISKIRTAKEIKIKQLKKDSFNSLIKNDKNIKQSYKPKLYLRKYVIIEKMRRWKMVDLKSNKPVVCNIFLKYHEIQLIKHFKNKARGLFEYYRLAFNYHWLKKQINYHMRWSLLLTITSKQKKSLSQIIKFYTKNVKIAIKSKEDQFERIICFLTSNEIQNYFIRFPQAWYLTLSHFILKQPKKRILLAEIPYKICQVKNFSNPIIKSQHLQPLYIRLTKNMFTTSIKIDLKKIFIA